MNKSVEIDSKFNRFDDKRFIIKNMSTIKLKRFELSSWHERTTTLIVSDLRHPIAEQLPITLLDQYQFSSRSCSTPRDVCLVFSPFKEYQDHVDKLFCYDHYQPDILRKLFDRQHRLGDAGVLKETRTLVVIDDYHVTSQQLSSDPELNTLVYNGGRHLGITTVIKIPYQVSEDLFMVNNNTYSPAIRDNLDYVMMYPYHRDMMVNLRLGKQFFPDLKGDELKQVVKNLLASNKALVRSQLHDQLMWL